MFGSSTNGDSASACLRCSIAAYPIPDTDAEPPPCNHPDYGQEGGDYWVICETCGKRKWTLEVTPVQAGLVCQCPSLT